MTYVLVEFVNETIIKVDKFENMICLIIKVSDVGFDLSCFFLHYYWHFICCVHYFGVLKSTIYGNPKSILVWGPKVIKLNVIVILDWMTPYINEKNYISN